MSQTLIRCDASIVMKPSEEGRYVPFSNHERIVARLNDRIAELERENAELRARGQG